MTGNAASTIAAYVHRLPLEPAQRRALVALALRAGPDASDAMAAVHAAIATSTAIDAPPAYRSVAARLALDSANANAPRSVARDVHGAAHLDTTPPLARSSMAPRTWPGWRLRPGDGPPRGAAAPRPWSRAATRRRVAGVALVVGQAWIATDLMASALPYHGRQPLEIAMLALFAILFAWISAGFWTAVAGFLVVARGGDRHAITRTVAPEATPADIPAEARTAIVMPICNEDAARVFAGLRATYESLARAGALDRFDFFVLSDSGNPDARVAELAGWRQLCRAVGGFGKVFYRWRPVRIKRKSGNVADFCRRWGRNYRYMIVLDADSVMSGECLARLVLLAEANPRTGIIQTAPRAAGRDTLYARVQQFAAGVYGPLYTAGLHYWQLGESHYWGHNAIIRVAPFMRHCALGRLPGRGALSGEILSHDFVEAALMRRAGWSVWIAYDLPGSYEEMPPNLIDELSRDRRWCQGNLMNFRLLAMKNLHPAHRVVFMTGVMAYLSAPLWFAFLVLSTALLAVHTLSVPQYFVQPYQLFPLWPQWRPQWAITLFSATALLLFLPKILAGTLVARQVGAYGGAPRLALSILLEMATSALFAPIRMLFHTEFVLSALTGRTVHWSSPPRDDAQTSWRHAVRRHGWHTLVGLAWAAGVWWLNPHFLPWLLPVVGALVLSVPLSVYTSRVDLGRRARERGLFLIPEETSPPAVLRATRRHVEQASDAPGMFDAVVDPLANALACAFGVARRRNTRACAERRKLMDRALLGGLDALSAAEQRMLLGDPFALSELHFAAWCSPLAHRSWMAAREERMMAACTSTVDALAAPRAPLAPALSPVSNAVGDDRLRRPPAEC